MRSEAGFRKNIFDLEINQFKPEDRVVIQQYAIVSETAPYEMLYDIAEDFQDELDALDYIKKTEIEAHPREEIKGFGRFSENGPTGHFTVGGTGHPAGK